MFKTGHLQDSNLQPTMSNVGWIVVELTSKLIQPPNTFKKFKSWKNVKQDSYEVGNFVFERRGRSEQTLKKHLVL